MNSIKRDVYQALMKCSNRLEGVQTEDDVTGSEVLGGEVGCQ